MMRYTLDTNCVIALDESRSEATPLRGLLNQAEDGAVTIQVAAIAAAERQQSGQAIDNFQKFQERLNRVGLGLSKILLPPMYVGLAYCNYCIVHGDELLELERKIHDILFPSASFEYAKSEDPKDWWRWLNTKCDVLTMWCHLYHSSDVFVTSDENFHTDEKNARLCSLGAGSIKRPFDLE